MSVMVGGTGIIGQDIFCSFGNGKYKTFEGTKISIENCVKAKVKDLVVEGKTIQDTEDLSNIESVAEKEENKLIFTVTNNGKNLVDTATIYNDKLQSGNIGDTFNPNDSMTYDVYKIEVEPNFNYGFFLIGYGQSPYIRVFNNDNKITKLFSSEVTSELYTWTFTVNSNAKYIVFNKPKTSKGEFKIYKIDKFVENINLPIPLRSLPNGVADTIEGNKLIQRVGKVVLDGSEDWKLQSCNVKGNGILNIFFIIQDLIIKFKEEQFIVCDKYIQQKTPIAVTTNEGILVNEEKKLYLRLFTSKATTVEEAKEYIKDNPFVVYYELATPIIHCLKNPQLNTSRGTNIITTENNIKPKLSMKVKVKK